MTTSEKLQARKVKSPLRMDMEFILRCALVTFVVLIIFIKFFYTHFYIPSPSMEPGLQINDRILVDRTSSWGDRNPERGSVVVFEDPGGWVTDEPKLNPMAKMAVLLQIKDRGPFLVKRVIGIEGDEIVCCDEVGRLKVNGVAIDETDYLPPNTVASGLDFSIRVPKDTFWVMGDNRDNSADSKYHYIYQDGPTAFVPVDNFLGTVTRVFAPKNHWRKIAVSDAFAAIDQAEKTP